MNSQSGSGGAWSGPAFGAPLMTECLSVQDEWIDYNGHLNMAYYNVLFDKSVDDAFERIGLGPECIKRTGSSFFTAEVHVTYLQELHAGALVKVSMQLLDFDGKRAHFFQELIHAEEGWVSATSEQISLHVDMGAKKVSPWPDDILAGLEAMHAAHRDLPVKPQIGHVIAIKRKAG